MATPSFCLYNLPYGHRKGTSFVQYTNSFFSMVAGIMGSFICGCLYTLFRMISIVSANGTLVNKLSTSNVEMLPISLVSCSIPRNSSDDFILYFSGVYCLMMLSNCLAILCVGVFI